MCNKTIISRGDPECEVDTVRAYRTCVSSVMDSVKDTGEFSELAAELDISMIALDVKDNKASL